jgi:hypothetical protein
VGLAAPNTEFVFHPPYGDSGQRKAHWPGAPASDVDIETKLNRLLPVQCREKLDFRFSIADLINKGSGVARTMNQRLKKAIALRKAERIKIKAVPVWPLRFVGLHVDPSDRPLVTSQNAW